MAQSGGYSMNITKDPLCAEDATHTRGWRNYSTSASQLLSLQSDVIILHGVLGIHKCTRKFIGDVNE